MIQDDEHLAALYINSTETKCCGAEHLTGFYEKSQAVHAHIPRIHTVLHNQRT